MLVGCNITFAGFTGCTLPNESLYREHVLLCDAKMRVRTQWRREDLKVFTDPFEMKFSLMIPVFLIENGMAGKLMRGNPKGGIYHVTSV